MDTAPAGPARVLVVDDDATVSDVARRYLERDGLSVEVVGDGERALARALAEPPDVVILDLMLPGMSGLDVCRALGWLSTASRRLMAYSTCFCTSSKPSSAACRRPRSNEARNLVVRRGGRVRHVRLVEGFSTVWLKSWSKTWIIAPRRSGVSVLCVDWVA